MNTGEARFQSNLKELKAFELKAEKERKFMEERIVEQTISSFEQDDAIVRKHPLAALKNRAAPFIIQRWNRHWIGDNGRFNRSPQTIFDWSSETKIASAFNTPELETVLQRGRADKIDLPSLRNRCPLMDNSVFEQFLPETSEENTIFEDENIIPLSLENGIKFAIEATTCCHLMADSFIGKSQNYAIPITVSQHIYSGSFHSLIVIGKPRVLGAVNNATIMRQFIKYQIKSNFVKRTLQIESSLRQESTSLVTECSPSEKKNDVTEPSPSKKNNNITESCQPEVEKNSDMEENTDNDFSDPLDSILDKIIPTPLTASSKPRASESGKQYSLFNANGLRFLVRSRPAPNCSVGPLFVQGKPLSIQPKIEYAPVAGAMCLGSEEWIWNYAKETFKQTNNHCLFRVHHDGNNVLQLQHSEPRHSNREHPCSPHVTRSTTNRRCLDNEKKELISSRTDRFTQLLENLTKLSHGRYLLLNESDGKLKLLAETNENDAATDVLDCSTIAKSVVLSREVPKFRDIFEGLESRIPLQWQIVQRRAPGCFVAKDSKLHFIAITPLEENIKERKSIKRTGYQKRKGMKRRRYNKD
uniref:NARG2_C domain-containing protein n=1 Tax=Heterorhabditis bacteriophora TaxID=37862 RepID=A0A1I7WMP1_HETBA